jgi:hypothetical protein
MTTEEEATQATIIIDKIRPILAGHNEHVQAAVLGYLLHLFVLGHHAQDPTEQDDLDTELLTLHTELVRDMVRKERAAMSPQAQH